MSFPARLLERAAGRRARLVLCDGSDPRVQEAARRLRERGIAEPILVGGDGIDPARDSRSYRVAEHLRARRPDQVRDGVHALDLAAEPVNFGAALVALGEADGCLAGLAAASPAVLDAALWAIGCLPGGRQVSVSSYLVLRDGGVLTFVDSGPGPEPTAAELAEIAYIAARARPRLVGDEPRVAFLSFSTRGSGTGPPVARVQEAVARFRALAPDIPADGELQAEAALVPAIGLRKAPDSPVAGRANVLVFPNRDAGGIARELVEHLAGVTVLGPVLHGLARPMAGLSRGATPDDIAAVAALVALQCDATPS